jgi:hypothetical protein
LEGVLLNKHVSSVGPNNPILIIFAICNHGRSAAKQATNSPYRSAARIAAPSIAPAEQAWWKAAGIDPVKVARQLWRHAPRIRSATNISEAFDRTLRFRRRSASMRRLPAPDVGRIN